jgi:hypothetical protein
MYPSYDSYNGAKLGRDPLKGLQEPQAASPGYPQTQQAQCYPTSAPAPSTTTGGLLNNVTEMASRLNQRLCALGDMLEGLGSDRAQSPVQGGGGLNDRLMLVTEILDSSHVRITRIAAYLGVEL